MNAKPSISGVWRQFLLVAGLLVMTFVLLAATFVGFMYAYRASQTRSALTDYARAVASLSAAYSTTGELEDNWNYQMSLAFASDAADIDAVICDESGRVVVCACDVVFCSHLGQQLPAALVEELRTEGSVSRTGTVPGVYEEDRYLVGLPLTSAATGETLGAVIVSSPRYDSAELGGQLRLTLFYTFLPCLLIGLVASLVVASRQFKTLSQMADAAQTLARGDFSVRVEVPRTTREVHDLAEGFNTMAEALEQTESMRQDFVAGVSHELKTPMTTIAGFVDGILDGTIPQEKQQQYLQTVSDEVHRLDRLVRNMLEASRLQEAQSQAPIRDRFDAVELVSRTLLTYEQRINDKGLDVDVQFPELEVPVSANADSITRVVSNLIDNAVKFSTPGSTLGIGVYTVQSKAYVYVRNEGPTIPAEELGRIFDRFHKTDKSRSEDRDGVGLGLYLVKSILNAHDEQITVTSQDGVTTFTFTLTLAG